MDRFRAAAVCLALGLVVSTAHAAEQAGDPAKGKIVFDQCTMCHNTDSTAKKLGPGLKGLFKRAKLQNGKKLSEENVRAQLEAGGNGMPAYKDMLSQQEKNDVVAYLKTL
jgi:cytochrome c2